MSDNEDNAQNAHRRKLFVKENGRPAKFFLHPSIRREGQRQKLKADIEAYGGRVVSTDDRVNTVLVGESYDDEEILRIRYYVDDDKHKRAIYVERLSFVQHCIKNGRFKHRLPTVKGMGGQVGHKHATKFTDSDDEFICTYIARLQPRKEAGGRSGNRLYQRVVELGQKFPEKFPWASRHSFHAWRERYKKKKHIFDLEIERIAKAEGTYDKTLWPEDRRMSKRRLRTAKRMEDEEEEDEEEYDQEEEEEEEDQLREDQGEEEEELSSQSEDGRGLDVDEYSQENEVPQRQDSGWEEQQVQDVDFDLTEIKKRKRVQSGAIPDQVTSKKRRLDQNILPSYPARSKGKEIAHESDQGPDSDNEIINSVDVDEGVPPQDFEDDEPGPSKVLRSPDRTLADPPSKSNHQQMNFTQETLVNTQSGIEFEPISHSTSANRRHSINASRSQPVSRTMEEQEQEPLNSAAPRPRPSQRPPPPLRATPGTSKGGQNAPSNSGETNQPASRGSKPLSKQRAPLTIVQPTDAPYRNTRARSRSVEPFAMPPPKSKPTRRRKQNPEAAKTVPKEDSSPIPIIETIEEEMDVEQILMTNDANISTVRARDPSLETDDAQTRQNLHPPPTMSARRPAAKTFSSTKIRPSDVLRRFSESSGSSWRYSMPSFQRPATQNVLALDENRRPRWSEPQARLGTFKLPEPRTPMNVRRARQESMSSVESFPLKGTRASVAKKEMQEQEKHTPYKPPEGTRAAQIAGSR